MAAPGSVPRRRGKIRDGAACLRDPPQADAELEFAVRAWAAVGERWLGRLRGTRLVVGGGWQDGRRENQAC